MEEKCDVDLALYIGLWLGPIYGMDIRVNKDLRDILVQIWSFFFKSESESKIIYNFNIQIWSENGGIGYFGICICIQEDTNAILVQMIKTPILIYMTRFWAHVMMQNDVLTLCIVENDCENDCA